jgi:hypothetical protein
MILTHTINGFFIKKSGPISPDFVLENLQKSNLIKNEVIMRGVSIAKLHHKEKDI